jgi:hypothetical protein
MNNGIKIYIASPYSNGDKLQNVRLQIDVFHILRDLGYLPFAPLLSHYVNVVRDRPHKDWIEYDIELLKLCDIVIRIRPKDANGVEIPSPGADIEEQKAKELGIPYYEFQSVDEVEFLFKATEFRL